MLKILVESQEIDFDGVITLRLLNPMFNDKMSHSYNCKTTLTARTKDVFNQLHLPEIGYSQVRFNGMLVTDSFTLIGAIYVNSITDNYLDFQFNAQNDFWNKVKLSFEDMDLPTDSAKYFPVLNNKHMDNFNLAGDDYSKFMNGVDYSGNPLTDDTTASVPFLKLNSIIAGIFEELNIQIDRNDLAQHADIDQLYIFNVNSDGKYDVFKYAIIDVRITLENEKYVLTSYNGSFHGLGNNAYVRVVCRRLEPIEAFNQLNGKIFKVNVIDDITISLDTVPLVQSIYSEGVGSIYKIVNIGHAIRKAADHLPGNSCAEFLQELEKLLAFRIFPDESTNKVRIIFLKNIINSNDVEDLSDIASIETEQSLDMIDGFKLSYEDPSDDARWSDRITELEPMLNIKDSVATFAALPIIGSENNDLRLVTSENCYYRFITVSFTKVSGWEFYSENVLPMQTASGKLTIESKFSPVLTVKAANFLWANVEKEGKFIILDERANDDYRLFFYRGDLQNFPTPVPLLTNDVYNAAGNKIASANLSLRWDGQYGLYEQLYREYLDLMTNKYRESTRYVKWPQWMLNSFAWWKKYRVNHQNYLVKSIDIELTAGGVKIKDSVMVPV